MIIAVVMVISAGIILVYNTWDNNRVEEESLETVTKLEELIGKNNFVNDTDDKNEENIESEGEAASSSDSDVSIDIKSSVNINGYNYIGIIYIPSLNNLAVPVIDTCTDANLKVSVCRYAGSLQNNNMVIAGHNYKSSFGKLSKLTTGSIAYFKSVDGTVYKYKCKEILTLSENDVYEMQTGDWDLTLFTCTYSGTSRLTLRFEIW